MRESVKNKKIILVAAIAIVIALIASVTLGLLLGNLKGNDLLGVATVADIDFSSNIGASEGNSAFGKFQIDRSTSQENIRAFLTGDTNYTAGQYTEAILTDDISFSWGTPANTAVFPSGRTLDGNGHKITLTANYSLTTGSDIYKNLTPVQRVVKGDGTVVNDSNDNINSDYYSGIFLAINKGTIKNLTFQFNNKYALSSEFWQGIWGIGGVCGKNDGTINNVKFIYGNNAVLHGMFNNLPAFGQGAKLFVGGICANQNGTLSNVHVQLNSGVRFTSDSRRYYTSNGNAASFHMSVTGGVYGAYSGTTARDNTFNLSCKGAEGSKLEACNYEKSQNTGWSNSAKSKNLQCIGAIAGFNIQGVNGVMCDFRGDISIPDKHYEAVETGKNNVPDTFEKKQFMAFCGTPTNYYHTGRYEGDGDKDWAPYLHMNNSEGYYMYTGNPFDIGQVANYPTIAYDSTPAGWPYGGNNSYLAGKRVKNDSVNRIDVSKWTPSSGIGNIDMSFATNGTKGIVNVTKTMPTNKTDIIWIAQAKGNIDGTEHGTMTKVGGYQTADKGKNLNFKLSLAGDYGAVFSSGHNFGELTIPNQGNELSYTGNDYFNYIVSKAFDHKINEIKQLTNNAPLQMQREDVKFSLYENNKVGVAVNEFIYPTRAQDIIMQYNDTKGDGYNGEYAYVNSDYRFCYDKTVFRNLQMKPASGDMTYDRSTNWVRKNTLGFIVKKASADTNNVVANFVDRIDIRRQNIGDSAEDKNKEVWKSLTGDKINVALNASAGTGTVTFDVDETTGSNGAVFQVIGYKNGYEVLFQSYDSSGNKTPLLYGSESQGLKIDSVLPVISGTEQLTKLEEIDYHINSNQSVTLNISDANSGVPTSRAVALHKKEWDDTSEGNAGSVPVKDYDVGADGNVTIEFTEHARYIIVAYDNAGNVQTFSFVVKIDTTTPDIVNKDQIQFYVKNADGSKDESSVKYDNDSANQFKASRSIFIDIPTNFGCAGGEVEYYVEGDKAGVNNTASKATSPTSGNIYTAEIKRTDKTDGTYVTYVFVLKSNARDEEGNHKTSSEIKTRVTVRVEQKTIHIYIDDIQINVPSIKDGIVKTYNASDGYDISNLSVNFFSDERKTAVQAELDEVNLAGFSYSADNFNQYVEFVSASFSKVNHLSTKPEEVAKDANEGEDSYYLVVELRAIGTVNFAIENAQESNNYYVFAINNSYQLKEGTLAARMSTVNRIGINKKVVNESDIKVISGSKTYGEEITDISEYQKVQLADGLLEDGDDIDALGLEFVWSKDVTGALVNAGNESFYAHMVNSKNYKPANADLKFRADFRIYRKAIDKIYIEGELNHITCFDVPEVSAYFYGVEDEIINDKVVGKKKVPLEIIYKNQDKEEVQFIKGQRAELGKYYYVILLHDDILTNYVNLSDPNILIGHFFVVGDVVQEGKNFDLIDLDPVTDGIQVEYINDYINFASLIKFREETLREKMEILYGYNEQKESNIYECGEYIVTLKVNADDNDPEGNRYAPTTLVYSVFVVPTTVVLDDSDNDWALPTYEENGETKTGVIFDKVEHRLTLDNVSPTIKEKLYNLLTNDEKATIDSGEHDLREYFEFNFTYRNLIGNVLEVKDAGTYRVILNVKGKRINQFSLNTEFNIVKRQINVEFDFDRILLEGGKDDEGNNLITIDKTNLQNIVVSKVFDNKTLELFVKDAFVDEVAYYTGKVAGKDFGFSHQFAGKEVDIKNADVYIIEYKFENDIIKDPNVELVNGKLRIEITPSIINLSLKDGETNYNGVVELLLTQEEIKDLITIHGILNPLQQIVFDTSNYSSEDVVAIAEEVDGQIRIGIRFINAGTYEIPIRLNNQENSNNQLGNGKLVYIINKKPLDSITLTAKYLEYGDFVEKDLSNASFVTEFNGKKVDIIVGNTGSQQLQDSHITDGQWQIVYLQNGKAVAEMINAGEYIARFTVNNKNVEAEAYDVKVVINKKRLGEYVGVFDYSKWYISKDGIEDYRLPNAEELEEGLMYRRTYDNAGTIAKKYDTYKEAYYSIRLRDEAELLAEGFTIVYKYNDVVADGVSIAGSHKVTAEIYNGDPNWEVKVVELWKTDANGEFVYKDDDSDEVTGNLSNGNGTPSQEKVKQVITFDIAKAELQTLVDELGAAAQLKSATKVYDGKPIAVNFTETQMKMFEENMLEPVIGKNEFREAGEYSVAVTFKMMTADKTNDPNYDTAEMEASIVINPIVVKIYFEVDEKYMDKETGLISEKYINNLKFGEAEPLTIQAYYYDRLGRKIYVKSLTIEVVKGSGDDIEFSAPKDETDEEGNKTILYTPNNYQVTAGISDSNYTFDEEDLSNFLRFTIKNETKATNIALFILLGIVIVLAAATGLVILYMAKMFNPAVQEIDIDIE